MIMLLSLCACNTETKQTQTTTTTTTDGQQNEAPQTVSLKIAGTDISEYRIVYSRAEYYAQGPKVFTTEWDFYKLIAKDVSERIAALTGVYLPVYQDSRIKEDGKKEILVGPTNRALSDVYDKMDAYSYQNNVKDGNLVIGGGYNSSYLINDIKISYSWGSTYHAFDYIEEYIKAKMNEGVSDIDLAEGFEQKGKAELKTVACIGDSITEGFKASDWNYCSFPAVMQRILWKDYIVINYGARGGSMRNDLKKPYTAQAQYTAAVQHAELFDLAFIMLGTNDSNYDATFSSEDNQEFKADALALANTLRDKNSNVKITLMNCPVYYGSKSPAAPFIRDLQEDVYELYKENGFDVTFYDMYTFTKNELGSSRFPDQIHPNDEGYAIMGEEMARIVPSIFDGSWDSDKQSAVQS